MIVTFGYRATAMLVAVVALLLTGGSVARSADPQGLSADDGLKVFKSANCMGCHKWSGLGGGGYGGAAANLRQTQLTVEQIEETVRCGRPSTGMPHFEADAYADGHCYGLKAADLPPDQMPPEPDHTLRPRDIRAVATYVADYVKGKGEPDLAQCQAFFGTGTRVCDVYAKQSEDGAVVQSASSGSDTVSSHPHVKVDSASDTNATKAVLGK